MSSFPKKTQSCSTMTLFSTEALVDFKLQTLFENEFMDPNKLVKIRTAPQELKDSLYKRLSRRLLFSAFPTIYVNEADKSAFVNAALEEMLDWCIAEYGLAHKELELKREHPFTVSREEDIPIVGYTNYVVVKVDKDTEKIGLVVEVKKLKADEGVRQLLTELKSAYDENNDQKTVYGFTTDAVDWRLVSYNGSEEDNCHLKGYKMLNNTKTNLLFPSMELDKELWMKECTLIVDIIYSCFVDIIERYKRFEPSPSKKFKPG